MSLLYSVLYGMPKNFALLPMSTRAASFRPALAKDLSSEQPLVFSYTARAKTSVALALKAQGGSYVTRFFTLPINCQSFLITCSLVAHDRRRANIRAGNDCREAVARTTRPGNSRK